MSKKGKSRMRSRTNILRKQAKNAAKKARQKAKAYDRTKYDGSSSEAA